MMATAQKVEPRAVIAPGRRLRRMATFRETATAYLFLWPNLLLMAAFLFLPLGWAFVLSFQDAKSFGPAVWTGLQNYTTLFGDDVFWRVLLNTVVFTVATVPVEMLIGLVLANLLNHALPGRGLLRTAIYLPIVISGLVTSLIGLLLFDEGVGIVNGVLEAWGIGGPGWQTSGPFAMLSIVLMTLWTWIGFAMVIYLAGLQSIPDELYEAAKVDGAGPWSRLRHITIPMLRPTTIFLAVIGVIFAFQQFTQVFVMTRGGPVDKTTTMLYYIYESAFQFYEMGYASALAFVLFLMLLGFTVLQLRYYRQQI